MDFSAGALIAAFMVSTVGLGFFLYGKKQMRVPQLSVGIGLMLLPMATTTAAATWGLAAGLLVALYVTLRLGH